MAWSNSLQTEILEQFADPRWHDCVFQHLGALDGVANVSEQQQWKVTARKTDDVSVQRIRDIAATRLTWTVGELVDAVGNNTSAITCGLVLRDSAGWQRRSGGGRNRSGRAATAAKWINVAGILAALQGRESVCLKEAQIELGVHGNAIAIVLKQAGWKRVKRNYFPRWIPPTTLCA